VYNYRFFCDTPYTFGHDIHHGMVLGPAHETTYSTGDMACLDLISSYPTSTDGADLEGFQHKMRSPTPQIVGVNGKPGTRGVNMRFRSGSCYW
jgi:hypothetical protein